MFRLIQRSRAILAFDTTESKPRVHFAVLSNIWDWQPVKLIEWHREKAGTIEGVHDVLKNELATGVLPSKYFGANAA